MAVITRETLVLRGVSVIRDGLTVVVRLGSGYPAAMQQTPAPFFVMRQPQPFNPHNQLQAERWANPDEHRDASSRTGRSAVRTVEASSFVPRTPVHACRSWQVGKPGQAGGMTSTGSTRWGLADGRMS